jgi:hypothetical protein
MDGQHGDGIPVGCRLLLAIVDRPAEGAGSEASEAGAFGWAVNDVGFGSSVIKWSFETAPERSLCQPMLADQFC